MIDDLLAKFEGAFAESTIRGYRGDFSRFAKWCSEHEVEPFDATSEDLSL